VSERGSEFGSSSEQQRCLFHPSLPLCHVHTLETVVWLEILRITSLADAQYELH